MPQNISERPLKASLSFERSDVPPIAEIEGVDLVTEGVITINKVIEYAKDVLGENEALRAMESQDETELLLICRLLFEEATDINFYVGRAVNPAHQNPDLPDQLQYKDESCGRAFRMPEENGQANQGKLFL